MNTEDALATLRRMKNKGLLSEADAAALDTVDRMLRDLRVSVMTERSVSSGLLSRERSREMLAETETFSVKKVSLPTSLGNAEANRDSPKDAWQIGYPWKDERFYGTASEVKAKMKAEIDEYERNNP